MGRGLAGPRYWEKVVTVVRPVSLYGVHSGLYVQAHKFERASDTELVLHVAACPCGWVCSDLDLLTVAEAGSAHLRAVLVA